MRLVLVFGLVCLLAATSGCGNAGSGSATTGEKSSALSTTASGKAATEDVAASQTKVEAEKERTAAGAKKGGGVEVMILDFAGIQRLIDGHRGKVVVVDYWSTSCEPCMKEFPGLVKLHNTYGTDKIACVSINLDYTGGKREKPEDSVPAVLEFLTEKDARFDNVVASQADSEIYKALELGSIPAVYVFDAQGKLAERFTGKPFTYQDVGQVVERLMNSSAKGA